ncbi:MAG: hypothetical protein KAV87_07925 [Desulfobacteraceae bacterium]|nr:hypothetical protein [Desulfobacteraceae bacterium]
MSDGDGKALPLVCLPGKGCVQVIEMSVQFGTLISVTRKTLEDNQKAMSAHAKESLMFWKRQQEQVDSLVAKFEKRELRLNDGKHVMEKNRDDINGVGEKLRVHEEGEYGAHSTVNKRADLFWKVLLAVGGMVISAFGFIVIILILVAQKHPEILDIILKKI